jgi:predicted transcriptional regulator
MNLPVVRDFMTKHIVALKPDQTMHEALRILTRNGFSGAPVVEDGKLAGMLSEKDLLRTFTSNLYQTMPEGKVRDHMCTTLTTCAPDDELFDVVQIFFQHSFRRLPVLENGKMIGIISRSDVVKQCQKIWDAAVPRTDRMMEGLMTPDMRAMLDDKKS